MNVKLILLWSGEDVVADLIEEKEDYIVFCNPIVAIPAAVLTLAKYQYQNAFVADQEINMLPCLTELMVECEFK